MAPVSGRCVMVISCHAYEYDNQKSEFDADIRYARGHSNHIALQVHTK